MPTMPYSEALKAVAARNPEFAKHLLEDAANALLNGKVDEGRALLRAHINATIGFEKLARLTLKNPKSLMRMLGPNGSPTAVHLIEIIANLAQSQGVQFQVQLGPQADAGVAA